MNQSIEDNSITSQGITKISVAGYKSIDNECSIEIRPLTILAGVNSSGKSSIIQPLLLLKQTLEATYDPGALLLNGPNVKFTSTDQFFSKVSSQDNNQFSVEIEINNSDYIKLIFAKENNIFDLKQMNYKEEDESEIILRKDMTAKEIIDSLEIPTEINLNLSFRLERIRCFFKLNPLIWSKQKEQYVLPLSLKEKIHILKAGEKFLNYKLESQIFFEIYINNMIHVPGIRGNPLRSYPISAVGENFPGTFDNYVASVINDWQIKKSSKLNDLARYLSLLGLTQKVSAKKLNDVDVEIKVSRLPYNSTLNNEDIDMVSIADVGFGVSQTLPAIVALLVAEPNQLVYLEQPEIHLHPRAQASLADILIESANRGVKVVIETHSDLILKRIQSLVAEDKIEPEKIKLHWFSRDQKGCTKVTTADLDKAGTFGDWPEDFSEVDLQEESRYLDAAELKLMSDLDEE
ncbi:AAA family ATPase [Crocosphaera sp. XPORK-15E]|uniref:AAA family ATPase n=1 Tax=Crocosphaera sp. XPORK-15E TaxID=3110247 RepID=UPI002B219E2C|nr:AAA family ATPase [Crocosphaera sp. XPORK-15E]MEA5533325.1 AAA family ATPase [Crocosphaera sp. XPORK-15E]